MWCMLPQLFALKIVHCKCQNTDANVSEKLPLTFVSVVLDTNAFQAATNLQGSYDVFDLEIDFFPDFSQTYLAR